MRPHTVFVIFFRICFRELLDPLLRNDKWLGQGRVCSHQRRSGPLDPEVLEDERCNMSRREEDPWHAVAIETGRHELAAVAGSSADKWERVNARRLYTRPVSAFSCLEREFGLVSFTGPVHDITFGPCLVELGYSGIQFVLCIGPDPIVWVVRNDGLRAADYERVVGRRQLHVVVVDAAVPVLGAGAFDEAFWGLDRTDGASGREDQVRIFGEKVRSPSVLAYMSALIVSN